MAEFQLPELAVGLVDGANTDYTTSEPFVSSSLRLWVDGLLVHGPDGDGFTVTGPSSFTTTIAWPEGTRLQVTYDKA
jgi:hypothetical protein